MGFRYLLQVSLGSLEHPVMSPTVQARQLSLDSPERPPKRTDTFALTVSPPVCSSLQSP